MQNHNNLPRYKLIFNGDEVFGDKIISLYFYRDGGDNFYVKTKNNGDYYFKLSEYNYEVSFPNRKWKTVSTVVENFSG